MNAKYIKWGDFLIANISCKPVNIVKYGKMIIDDLEEHRKELNVMEDFES